jgi:multiple antibiotic resistance protein
MFTELLARIYMLLKAIPWVFTALMPCVNPIGTAIILLGLTRDADAATRRQLAKKIAVSAALLLIGSLLGGSYLLEFFGVSVPIVQVAGGLVLASMGWGMLNQSSTAEQSNAPETGSTQRSLWDNAFYPFTFPITVGPGCIAVAITLSAHSRHDSLLDTTFEQVGAVLGIVGVSLVVYFSIVYSDRLTKRLGPSGTSVMMRLIAFLVLCIGAQISWAGVQSLVKLIAK